MAKVKKVTRAEDVIKEIIGRGIQWYDYNNLSPDKKKLYYGEAQRLLRSEVMINEMNAFISDLVKEIAFSSQNHETTTALRYSINGIQALRERLESIEDPNKETAVEDLNSAI